MIKFFINYSDRLILTSAQFSPVFILWICMSETPNLLANRDIGSPFFNLRLMRTTSFLVSLATILGSRLGLFI